MKTKINSRIIAVVTSILYSSFYFVVLNLINPKGNDWTVLEFCLLLSETSISLFSVFLGYKISRRFFSNLQQGYRYALLILISAVIFCIIYLPHWVYLVRYLIYGRYTDVSAYAPQLFGSVNGLHLPVAIITIISMHTAEMHKVQMKLSVMEKTVAETKLKSLQKQVDPHFLFNSLNILTSLIRSDSERSILFTQKLSEVYRFYLTTRKELVIHLDEELAFVRNYFYLIQCRFGNAFALNIDSTNGDKGAMYIIPGTIQLLVENVIKHNSATENDPINIDIILENDTVKVSNMIRRKNDPGSGYGLNNLAEQYELIADRKVVFSDKDGFFVVKIPLFKSFQS